MCSICRVRRQEIENFIIPPFPGGGIFAVENVKLIYLKKKHTSLLWDMDHGLKF